MFENSPFFSSAADQDPFAQVEFESYDCVMHHYATGKPVFEMRGVEVPKAWSRNARDVLVSKYFRKAGVPSDTMAIVEEGVPEFLWRRVPVEGASFGSETSVKQVIHRIVGHWTYVGLKEGYFDPGQDLHNEIALRDASESDVVEIFHELREINARRYYRDMAFMMVNQMGAPNSPQFFNTGLAWAYGIKGSPAGHWRVDEDVVRLHCVGDSFEGTFEEARELVAEAVGQTSDSYEHPQPSACFILGLDDSMMGPQGILKWYEREARIFKFGSGAGTDISSLRPTGAPLSGGGKSSGAMSWAEVADRSAGAIKSGGTVRRAAKMVVMGIEHPDVVEFIEAKQKAEVHVASLVAGSRLVSRACQRIMDAHHNSDADLIAIANREAVEDGVPPNYVVKAAKLAEQGYKSWDEFGSELDTNYEGEAYHIVPFQNANHSVSIPSSFYEAVDNDGTWDLRFKSEGIDIHKQMAARELDRKIALATWFSGDPGVQYRDTINAWNVTPEDGPIRASNPCLRRGTKLMTGQGLIPVEDLTGQDVYLYDGTGSKGEANFVLGKVWKTGHKSLVRLHASTGSTIDLTPDHLVMTSNGWVAAAKCEGLDAPSAKASSDVLVEVLSEPMQITRVEVLDETDDVYDFSVSTTHMGMANGFLVHNCSEHLRPDNSACNLASIRLTRFYDPKANVFDVEAYRYAINLWLTTLDISVTMASYPDRDIAINAYLWRDTGLGYCDMGALLMSMGLAYDSDMGREVCGRLTAILQAESVRTSALLAQKLGAYPRFEANRKPHLECLQAHASLAGSNHKMPERFKVKHWQVDQRLRPSAFEGSMEVGHIWDNAWAAATNWGQRNAELTVCAPTGTIAILMDCDTTGIEPMFGLSTMKQLVGGSNMSIRPARCVEDGLLTMGVEDPKRVAEMLVAGEDVGDLLTKDERKVFATAMDSPNVPAIAWDAHIRMVAAAQSFFSGGISKTINAPADATVEDIAEAYRLAHDLGCKCVALYRDQSKLSAPLSVSFDVDKKTEPEKADVEVSPAAIAALSPGRDIKRVRLGSIRNAGIDVCVSYGDANLYVRTTRYQDGSLGEIWVTYSGDQGIISALIDNLCKTANIAIQYGVPPQEILKSWLSAKFDPRGMVGGHPFIKVATSMVNLAARIILYHEFGENGHGVLNVNPAEKPSQIPDEVMANLERTIQDDPASFSGSSFTGLVCPNCGSSRYVQSGTSCHSCKDCGYSGGCG